MAVLAVARLVLRHSRNQHRVVGRIGIVVIRIGAGVLMVITCAPALAQPAEASLEWLPRTKMLSLHRGCLIADQGKQHGCKNEVNFFRHVLALLNSRMHWIETRFEFQGRCGRRVLCKPESELATRVIGRARADFLQESVWIESSSKSGSEPAGCAG